VSFGYASKPKGTMLRQCRASLETLLRHPLRWPQTEGTEWDECDRINPNQAQSSRIKANQGKSNQLGYPIDSTNPKV
jgi:hypothetical protein